MAFCIACGGSKESEGGGTAPTSAFTPWTHFRGNAALNGVGEGTISNNLKPVWTFKTGGACISSPVTDGETVYIGSYDSTLYALDINTGKDIWRFKAGDEIEASPVIFGDAALIGDLGGNFFSVNRKDGTVNWRFKVRDKIAGSANIIEDKNFVIFGSYNDTLYCLNINDGQPVWKYASGSYINGTAATDGKRVVFGGCDAGLHVINADDGTLIGKIDTESYIAGSAVINNNFAYVGSYGKKLLGINIEEMKIVWTYQNDSRQQPFVASPALRDSFLIAPSRDNFVHCVNPADGKLIWKFAAKGAVDASPVIVGDKVVAGCGSGSLYLIELTSGKLIKSFDIGGSLNGTPLVTGGMIIVGDENGLVTALGAI
ncbi:MAG: PQQ-binding-like beta-propeller repeat protein [Chitinispirillia bacterium]|nr:PQQ-binding-like beta-propeller repeat protein [Chitinispirillia bacterium]MCL2269105.1 PQQ-binding-like beta-propeller repeat protein [Chitinispirillia bacterium]